MTDTPRHLLPFVLSPAAREPARIGPIDLYLPDGDGPFPAVVLVHGGPLPPDMSPTPRDWPVYRGYANLLASLGLAAAVVDHRLHVLRRHDTVVLDYPTAALDVADAVDTVRADPRVDGDRVVLWFFSGGGLLAADWLREQPEWLRGIALSYPALAPLPGWPVDARFRPVEAVAEIGPDPAPIVLTSVGREKPEIAVTVEDFLDAADEADVLVEVVEVPDGQHAFDVLDHNEKSREAVREMAERVARLLE